MRASLQAPNDEAKDDEGHHAAEDTREGKITPVLHRKEKELGFQTPDRDLEHSLPRPAQNAILMKLVMRSFSRAARENACPIGISRPLTHAHALYQQCSSQLLLCQALNGKGPGNSSELINTEQTASRAQRRIESPPMRMSL
jgi:hypothetical protein